MRANRPAHRLLAAVPLLAALGCSTAEDAFVEGRRLDACKASVPVCSTSAGCVLDDGNYTSGNFAQGAARRAIVRTTVPSEIEVSIYFRTEASPGLETEIAWWEVGCKDRKSEGSAGTDVFAEAGADRVWRRKSTVYTPGDHLVEVFSDAQAEYLLKVAVRPVQ